MTSDDTGPGVGKRRQLGRGLSSLLGDDEVDVAQVDRMRQTRQVAIESIDPSSAQPRRLFDESELQTLAESIRERGVLQPILLRRREGMAGRLEIIAGERRWRAAQIAGLHEMPALVREFTDTEALEIALIENIQRSDLTALEEAAGFQRLIEEYGHTQEDVAHAVGKSRSHVANTLRLLALPPKARGYLEAGRLTAGHARALLVSGDAERLADYVVAGGLSVRATERLVQGRTNARSKTQKPPSAVQSRVAPKKDADTRALEQTITESLGLTVDIVQRDTERGALTIHYQSLEQLDDLLARLTGQVPFTSGSLMVTDDDLVGQDSLSLDQETLFKTGTCDDEGEQGVANVMIDFDALMAQTATLLATENIEHKLSSKIDERNTGIELEVDPTKADDPGPSALIRCSLDALVIVDPLALEQKKEAGVDIVEKETKVMANMDLKNLASQDETPAPSSPKVIDPNPGLDDEHELSD